jgi:hypothetical protein
MQEHLKNPSAVFRKAYLRLYVARIELGDDQIEIFGRRMPSPTPPKIRKPRMQPRFAVLFGSGVP